VQLLIQSVTAARGQILVLLLLLAMILPAKQQQQQQQLVLHPGVLQSAHALAGHRSSGHLP
jgi:hypothetical protein